MVRRSLATLLTTMMMATVLLAVHRLKAHHAGDAELGRLFVLLAIVVAG